MKLIVPNEIRYGIQERYDTYSKKLGYMIYANKSNGTYGQQLSFEGWRDKRFEPKDISNDYQLGFVLNKGHLNKYYYGASAKFRVFHPEGFEFEISLENLSMLMDNTIISYGEINVPCCIGWDGANVYLVPQVDLKNKVQIEHFDVSKNRNKAAERLNKINSSGKPLSFRTLTTGKIVEDKSGNRFIISAPTKSNYNREEFAAFLVKKEGAHFELKSNLGHAYHASLDETMPKVFYPLTNINCVIEKGIEETFVKFVDEKDLTETELKNKQNLVSKVVFQFNKEQILESVPHTREDIQNFIDNLHKTYEHIKLADYNEPKGKVILRKEVFKILGKMYYVVLGHNYRLGYGRNVFEKELKEDYEKLQRLSEYTHYGSEKKIEMYLVPVTSEEDVYNGFNPQTPDLICLYLNRWCDKSSEKKKNILQEIEKKQIDGLFKIVSAPSQEEIDAQKRILIDY